MDEVDGEDAGCAARIKTLVVGHDITRGERLQWIMDGGKYKASFLLPDLGEAGEVESWEDCLISEVHPETM